MDEFKEERERMKSQPFKVRFDYFWEYHKFHVIGGIALVLFCIGLIHSIVTRKDVAFKAIFMNSAVSSEEQGASYKDKFTQLLGIDTEEYEVLIDQTMFMTEEGKDEESMNAAQQMQIYLAAGEIDVFATNNEIFCGYAYSEAFQPPEEYLSEEALEALAPYIVYIDGKVLEELNAVTESFDIYTGGYPISTDPSTLEDPIAVGISTECATEEFKNTYRFFSLTGATFAIPYTTTRPEAAMAFLEFAIGMELD